jgi:DNA helicase-2/ATP-dependent DNA helicase PcrA
VVATLRVGGKAAVTGAYDHLVDVVKILSSRHFRPAWAAHTKRLARIQERLAYRGRPVPGLTTHQAKAANGRPAPPASPEVGSS